MPLTEGGLFRLCIEQAASPSLPLAQLQQLWTALGKILLKEVGRGRVAHVPGLGRFFLTGGNGRPPVCAYVPGRSFVAKCQLLLSEAPPMPPPDGEEVQVKAVSLARSINYPPDVCEKAFNELLHQLSRYVRGELEEQAKIGASKGAMEQESAVSLQLRVGRLNIVNRVLNFTSAPAHTFSQSGRKEDQHSAREDETKSRVPTASAVVVPIGGILPGMTDQQADYKLDGSSTGRRVAMLAPAAEGLQQFSNKELEQYLYRRERGPGVMPESTDRKQLLAENRDLIKKRQSHARENRRSLRQQDTRMLHWHHCDLLQEFERQQTARRHSTMVAQAYQEACQKLPPRNKNLKHFIEAQENPRPSAGPDVWPFTAGDPYEERTRRFNEIRRAEMLERIEQERNRPSLHELAISGGAATARLPREPQRPEAVSDEPLTARPAPPSVPPLPIKEQTADRRGSVSSELMARVVPQVSSARPTFQTSTNDHYRAIHGGKHDPMVGVNLRKSVRRATKEIQRGLKDMAQQEERCKLFATQAAERAEQQAAMERAARHEHVEYLRQQMKEKEERKRREQLQLKMEEAPYYGPEERPKTKTRDDYVRYNKELEHEIQSHERTREEAKTKRIREEQEASLHQAQQFLKAKAEAEAIELKKREELFKQWQRQAHIKQRAKEMERYR
ncbi:unnamed protein product [Vitrella brassicaformis CCMP3155]|uniref:Uncharacterized protein n=3 Tax=Vitrella brassicaformis TaxID=1169539 RepID=A0A0G4FRG0_VITBC|nr:unnamed protein product [Vitrella brassicaformis CCMP3155]|eukprot:CEM16657.1 unnamed protein product [Vitrella brassicaformis CCMP3155]